MDKDNYICILGKIIELTAEQIKKLKDVFDEPVRKLAELEPGDIFKVGHHEFIVLEHCMGETAVIYKGLLHENVQFGSNNNFYGSDVDEACEKFGAELAEQIGDDNIVEHTLDLTSDDGLKDYGEVNRQVSLLTADQYRRYVSILDRQKLDKWWWLATPFSTPTHEDADFVKCVSPSGRLYGDRCSIGGIGVRPFCILKSNIFVS